MKRIGFSGLAVTLLVVAPAFSQGFGNGCTPAGTWYGGQDNSAKYLLTIVPSRANVYTVFYQAAFKPKVPVLTQYTGELVNEKGVTYEGYAIALVNMSDLPPTPPGSPSVTPEIWAIRERGHQVDCNTLKFEITFFAAYYWSSNKVPFQDTPDYYRLQPGSTIVETYRRMPTTCRQCTDK